MIVGRPNTLCPMATPCFRDIKRSEVNFVTVFSCQFLDGGHHGFAGLTTGAPVVDENVAFFLSTSVSKFSRLSSACFLLVFVFDIGFSRNGGRAPSLVAVTTCRLLGAQSPAARLRGHSSSYLLRQGRIPARRAILSFRSSLAGM